MVDSEIAAITKLRNKDISGLETLVGLYQQSAVNLAALITQDQGLAEDVVSECFLTVFRQISTFDTSRAFHPWFFKIVTNKALKTIRVQNRQISWDDLSFAEDWMDRITLSDNPWSDPPTLAEQTEIKKIIQTALDHLTPKQRAVIYLRFYCDLGESDMASLLRVPGGTVKSRLSAALHRLRKWLTKDGNPSFRSTFRKG